MKEKLNIQHGQLVNIIGYCGSGKTAFSLSLAADFISGGKNVLYISSEVGGENIEEKFKLALNFRKDRGKFIVKKQIIINENSFIKDLKRFLKQLVSEKVFIDYIFFEPSVLPGFCGFTTDVAGNKSPSLHKTQQQWAELKGICHSDNVAIIGLIQGFRRDWPEKPLDIKNVPTAVAKISDKVMTVKKIENKEFNFLKKIYYMLFPKKKPHNFEIELIKNRYGEDYIFKCWFDFEKNTLKVKDVK